MVGVFFGVQVGAVVKEIAEAEPSHETDTPSPGFREPQLLGTAVNKGAVREVEFHSCLSLARGARG